MNKKKIILLILVAFALTIPAMANEYQTGVDNGAGKMKLGAIVGTDLLATIGFEASGGGTELNIHGGFGYSYSYIGYNPIVGANFLFRIAEIDFGGGIYPMMIGPQVDFKFRSGGFAMDALAMWRWEYTFWFPLNLFVEFGGGVELDFYNGGVDIGPSFVGNVGVRYVFGM